ncbi:hypothetical protein [Lysinibacillus pakistanensis]|uniref:Uncharacterized protein n=1 Tax=Lysinibacillus pakistanensis TaxID=759811 RepID=A0AAX3WPW7_9BACI|nr:hypothetical protein [Lysinibacillus pakistanensis]MDM5234145.1 hypothetical protein [Lysinibacillus pakistanensis]WHY44742.1 hypothetical protein QNH22_15605 [Lysinibacillus pakistanensis]WHY49749.1 hypothetical protein QNH24_15575 [Lysinibacillus pakistanensis]
MVRLALVETTGYFSHLAGLTVPMIGQEPVPATAGEIIAAYEKAAEAVKE